MPAHHFPALQSATNPVSYRARRAPHRAGPPKSARPNRSCTVATLGFSKRVQIKVPADGTAQELKIKHPKHPEFNIKAMTWDMQKTGAPNPYCRPPQSTLNSLEPPCCGWASWPKLRYKRSNEEVPNGGITDEALNI